MPILYLNNNNLIFLFGFVEFFALAHLPLVIPPFLFLASVLAQLKQDTFYLKLIKSNIEMPQFFFQCDIINELVVVSTTLTLSMGAQVATE